MRRLAVALVVALVSSPALAQSPSVQETLLRAKPAVALVVVEVGAEVTVRCGPGAPERQVTPAPYRQNATGFFVSPSGWMLTNAHVVVPAHQPPGWLQSQLAERGVREACPGQTFDRRALVGASVSLDPSVSVLLSNGVRLPAKVVKISPPLGGGMSGRDLALLQVEAADMPALALADSAQVKIGDKLSIIGFPGVVMTHELLSASAKVEASVTVGAVSGLKQDRANQPVIQTDAAAEAGASGAPAIDASGRAVGVLTFVTEGEGGSTVQGFNFVIPSAAVREFLEGTPATLDEPSRFNAAWHAGLSEHFAGNYSRAERHLAEANRLVPDLPDVKRVAAENAERAKSEPWLPWGRVGAALVILGLAGYGAVLWRRRQRNQFRIRPSEVAQLLEGAEAPLLLDVRADSAYDASPVRIPRSLRIAPSQLDGDAALPIDRTRAVVAYCT
jgi:S1-C subfamily serine protease